jgi:hypothetical protein
VLPGIPGLGRNILFEAGYRGLVDAAVKKPIQSIVAEYAADKGLPELTEDLHAFDIELQDVRRTFVEKDLQSTPLIARISAAIGCATIMTCLDCAVSRRLALSLGLRRIKSV